MRGSKALLCAVAALGVFAIFVFGRGPLRASVQVNVNDRVVISAPVQVLLAGGDRFLAANFETIRAMATADDRSEVLAANASFLIRVHGVVAQLNPCHEDNYYVANAALSWGGAAADGMDILRRAMECRHWDEFPPFFYGFNQWFFNRNAVEARRAMEMAALRSRDNATALRRIGIMIQAGEYQDDRAALAFLRREREQANDDKLREMLDKRVQRIEGLVLLRDAQAAYEAQTGKPLTDPRFLLESGILTEVPKDPLRLGYEFVNGRFRLREVNLPDVRRN